MSTNGTLAGKVKSRVGAVPTKPRAAGSGPTKLPVPLPAYVPFPTHLLPVPVARFVREAAAAIGCDEGLLGLPALVALAAAVGNARSVRVKRGWTEPAVVWGCVVGDSGTLKTPALRAALAPLTDRQRVWFEEHREALDRHRDIGDPDRPEPVCRRLVVQDVTPERLGGLLAENPRGLVLHADELAAWVNGFTRYRGRAGGSDLPAWLSMHRAEPLTVDRKTDRRTVYVPRAAVSVVGGIQPGTLARVMTAENTEAGFEARLLVAMPPAAVKRWSEAEVSPDALAGYARTLDALLELQPGEDGSPVEVTFDAEAKQVWVRFYDGWADRQAGASGPQASTLSKLEGTAARFALLHHLAESVGAGCGDLPVGAESVHAAAGLVGWFAREAERVRGVCRETTEEKAFRQRVELVRKIAARQGGRVAPRDLMHSHRERYPSPDVAEAALVELESAGVGFMEQVGAGPRGGRPSVRFVVAPHNPTPHETPDRGSHGRR